jgi:hypothetical protein
MQSLTCELDSLENTLVVNSPRNLHDTSHLPPSGVNTITSQHASHRHHCITLCRLLLPPQHGLAQFNTDPHLPHFCSTPQTSCRLSHHFSHPPASMHQTQLLLACRNCCDTSVLVQLSCTLDTSAPTHPCTTSCAPWQDHQHVRVQQCLHSKHGFHPTQTNLCSTLLQGNPVLS